MKTTAFLLLIFLFPLLPLQAQEAEKPGIIERSALNFRTWIISG
ncbi:MAG: hypothetical protein ACLFM7_12820 [Bacteroidales bacterium]